jgi:uncharacterized SAM-binding protein YcdF (DUF218 family)
VAQLERPYADVRLDELPSADAIVMLGGGSHPALREAAGFRLTRAGDRLFMAVEFIRRGKAPVLVLGGAGTRLQGQFAWSPRSSATGSPRGISPPIP